MRTRTHPGEFIAEVCLEPNGISGRELASLLDVLKGTNGVSPEMALRLSETLGRSPESWLMMQYSHDLWLARKRLNLDRVSRASFKAA